MHILHFVPTVPFKTPSNRYSFWYGPVALFRVDAKKHNKTMNNTKITDQRFHRRRRSCRRCLRFIRRIRFIRFDGIRLNERLIFVFPLCFGLFPLFFLRYKYQIINRSHSLDQSVVRFFPFCFCVCVGAICFVKRFDSEKMLSAPSTNMCERVQCE